MSDIPIIINVFNRLECLQRQIQRFEEMGLTKIFIIDNASTYPPTVAFLKSIKYPVIHLKTNVGSYALWEAKVMESPEYRNYIPNADTTYYVYTDPDIIPIPDCPDDVLEYLQEVLEEYTDVSKVGLGLRIDNLPDNEQTKLILEWEEQYWKDESYPNLFKGYIDTTFSLYRPNGAIGHTMGLRTGFPYVAEHTTWYEDTTNLSGELQYYVKHCEPKWTHWYKDMKGKV